MRILDDEVGLRRHGVAHDALVKRMIPDGGRRHDNAVLAQRLGQFFEVFRMAADHLVACFLQRRRIEQPVAAQVFVVIADEQFEFCAGPFCQPCGAMHTGLFFDRRIDNGKDFRKLVHCRTLLLSGQDRIIRRRKRKSASFQLP